MIRLFSLFAALFLLGAAAPPPAQSLLGEWRNTKNTVHLRVKPCGNVYCGTVTWAAAQQRADARKGNGKELVGSVLFRDLKLGSDGTWRGEVYIPDVNSSASASIVQLSNILIRVSGCSLLGLACKTQHWHRIA